MSHSLHSKAIGGRLPVNNPNEAFAVPRFLSSFSFSFCHPSIRSLCPSRLKLVLAIFYHLSICLSRWIYLPLRRIDSKLNYFFFGPSYLRLPPFEVFFMLSVLFLQSMLWMKVAWKWRVYVFVDVCVSDNSRHNHLHEAALKFRETLKPKTDSRALLTLNPHCVCVVGELVIPGYVRPCCVSVTLVSSLLPSNSAVYCLDYTAYFCIYACWNDQVRLISAHWPFKHRFMHTENKTTAMVLSNQMVFCIFVYVFVSPPGKLSHVYKFQCWSLIQEIIPVRSHLISKSLQVTHAIWIIIWVWNSRFCNVKLFMRIHRVDQKKFASVWDVLHASLHYWQ